MKPRLLTLFALFVIPLLLLSVVVAAKDLSPGGLKAGDLVPGGGAGYPPLAVNIGLEAYPTLDPALVNDTNSAGVVEQLFAGLVEVDDETGLVNPELATSWEVSADRRVFTFTLRNDFTWSDGNPVTAHDARYGILRTLDPATGANAAYTLYDIVNAQEYNEGVVIDPDLVGVHAPDATSLIVETNEPASYLPAILASPVARPVPQWTIAAHGPGWTEPGNIVTSGAYRFAETLPDDVLVLTKNPGYYDAANVQIEQVNLWIRNRNIGWQMYLDGQLDTAVLPDDAAIPPALAQEVTWQSSPGTNYLGFNVTQPPFDNVLVRKAFSAAIDRPVVTTLAYGEVRRPALTFTPPGVLAHVDGYVEGVGLPYNPAQAQDWLSDAGYPGGAGLPPITLWFNANPNHELMAGIVRDQWYATLGVSVTVESLPWPDYQSLINSGGAQLFRAGWLADYLDPNNFHGDALANRNPFGGWSNPTYDSLLYQATTELVPATRASLYRQAEGILVETEAVMAPLNYFGSRVATKPYLNRTFPPFQYDIAGWRMDMATSPIGPGGGVLDSTDGRVSLSIPPGTLGGTADVSLFPQSWIPPAFELGKVGAAFGLTVVNQGSGQPVEPLPGTTYQLEVTYDEADVAGLRENTVALYYWDGADWIREPDSAVDTAANLVSANPGHFSLWTLMAGPDPLPVRLNMNLGPEPVSLDPARVSDLSSLNAIEQLFASLLDEDDESGAILPELATGWDISADRMVYTFTLRSDAYWSDGNPVTAGDVRYAIVRALDPGNEEGYYTLLYPIENAEAYHTGGIVDPYLVGVYALDPNTLVIRLEQPATTFLRILTTWITVPLPQWAIDAYGDTWTEPGNIVTSGPYLLAGWVPGSHLLLEKNPGYYDTGDVPIEEVVMWTQGDENTAWEWYLNGDLDTINVPLGATLDQVRAQEYRSDPNACTYYYGFNADQPPFDDPLVRKAFAAAVDRQGLLALTGFSDYPALTFSPPPVFGHVDGYTEGIGLPYNPGQAQGWLEDAGYPGGAGLPPVTLHYNELESHQQVAEFVGDSWMETLGVTVNLESWPWDEFQNFINGANAQVFRQGWCADYLDAHNFLNDGLANRDRFGGWANPAYDTLLAAAQAELDPAVRQDLFRQAEQILVEDDAVIIPLYYYVNRTATRLYLTRTFSPARYDIASWWISKVREAIGPAGGDLVSYDGNMELTIPPGLFDDTVILSRAPASAYPPAGPLGVVGQPFSLKAVYAVDGTAAEPLPGTNYNLVVHYDTTDLGTVGENLLALYFWDGGQWVREEGAIVDSLNNTVTAVPDHFSTWALMGAAWPLPPSVDLRLENEPVLDPALASDAASTMVVEQLFAGLTKVDQETGAVLPELADSWNFSTGATVFTITLRPDIYWSDGNPITAGDVRYGILHSLDPATNANFAYVLYMIENAQDYHDGYIADPNLVGVSVVNPTTVRFDLNQPAAYFPTILSRWVARPMPQWAIDAHGPGWTEPGNIVTSGPYRLVAWDHGHHLRLVKDPGYIGAAGVQIEEINFWVVEDANLAWDMYLAGDLDTVLLPAGAPGEPWTNQELNRDPANCTYYYGYTNTKYPFDDDRVRKAFTLAVDRQGLIDDVLQGGQIPATTFAPPSAFGAPVPGLYGLSYDPVAAQTALNAFLTEAGMTPGEFNALGITLRHNASELHSAIASAIAQMWQNVLGVTVTVETMAWPDYLASLQKNTPVEDAPHIYRMGWCHDYPDEKNWVHDVFNVFAGANLLRRNCLDPNCGTMTTSAFDDLTELANEELNLADRIDLYHEAERILAEEEAAYAPIYHFGDLVATRPYLLRTYAGDAEYIADWETAKVRRAIDADPGALVSYYGDTNVLFPADTFDDITIVSHAPAIAPPPPPLLVQVGSAFELKAENGANGTPVNPNNPYQIFVFYAEGELGDAVEGSLALYYWDGANWVKEPSSAVDTAANSVTATPNHFSRWVVLGLGAAAGTIEVSVELQGRSEHGGAEVCAMSGGVPANCAVTDPAGSAVVPVMSGTYTVTVEIGRYLDGLKANQPVDEGQAVSLSPVKLLGGDTNDDDIVNILDLAFIGARYNLAVGQPGYDSRANINDDGVINILDLTVSGANYLKTSPVPWANGRSAIIFESPGNVVSTERRSDRPAY